MRAAEEAYLREITDGSAKRLFYAAGLVPLPDSGESEALSGYLLPDDERRLASMLREGCGTAELTLVDFPHGNYAFAAAVPVFSSVYLVLYPFREKKSRDAFPPRLRAVASEIALSAGRSVEEKLLSSVAVSEMLSECMLLSEGADEPTNAYYDLPALLARFAEAMRRAEDILDARIIADAGSERFLAVPLSLPHFCKILTLLVSALAPLSRSRVVRLSLASAADHVRLVRLTTDLPETLASLGRTEDMLYLACHLRDAALPLLTAERIASRCGYALSAQPDDRAGTFCLTLRLSSPEGEIPDFRFRDQFASFEDDFASAVYFVSGKRPENVTASREELPG